MMTNQRFLLNDDGYIIDKLTANNSKKAEWHEERGYKKHENRFRELLLWRRLGELLPKLLINADPVRHSARAVNQA